MSPPKKPRLFQEEWRDNYGFVQQGDRVICALCCESVVLRTSSVTRHYKTKHELSLSHMDIEDRTEHIRKCVVSFTKQRTGLVKFVKKNEIPTRVSYTAALCIARKGKPFTDGEFLKETFIQCAEDLFQDFSNKKDILAKIRDVPLSARSVQRRISDMADDVDTQLKNDLRSCDVVSFTLDESTDINDVARLTLVARFYSPKRESVIEEVCGVYPMFGTTKGEDIFKVFTAFADFGHGGKFDLKSKLFSLTTDGAPAMTGKNIGFVQLLQKELGRPILAFHCVIHQENLCAKLSSGALNEVMSTVVKIVNTIVARSSLTHRRFKALLEEMESTYGDLSLHCNVRWLSRGKVLTRFVNCVDAIKIFLREIGLDFPQLENKEWLLNLMFLTDITKHLNALTIKLQGKRLTVLNLYEEWLSFSKKLLLFEDDLQTCTLRYFPNVQMLIASDPTVQYFDKQLQKYISALKEEFSRRFQDLQKHGPMFRYLLNPEKATETDIELQYFQFLGVESLQMELIDFQSSDLWRDKFSTMRDEISKSENLYLDICSRTWTLLPPKFSAMKKVAFALLSAFGTSYYCEQIFSLMKNTLSPIRNRLTVENSEACLRLQTTGYQPDLMELTSRVESQGSH